MQLGREESSTAGYAPNPLLHASWARLPHACRGPNQYRYFQYSTTFHQGLDILMNPLYRHGMRWIIHASYNTGSRTALWSAFYAGGLKAFGRHPLSTNNYALGSLIAAALATKAVRSWYPMAGVVVKTNSRLQPHYTQVEQHLQKVKWVWTPRPHTPKKGERGRFVRQEVEGIPVYVCPRFLYRILEKDNTPPSEIQWITK